jgi:peptidoglycan/LPS O-acetylase OafA/YrhL
MDPNGRSDRYSMLDVWRGLACLMVVVHHAGYALAEAELDGSWRRWLVWLAIRRLDVGVTLFFVISGYCIAASLEATRRRGDTHWTFLARRVWRIYPPYWIALLGFATAIVVCDGAGLGRLCRGSLGVKLDPLAAYDWPQWFGNVTLTETWRPHFWGPERNVLTAVAWSLCFEEQFYLIGFFALMLAPRRLGAALAGTSLAILGVRVLAWSSGRLDALSGTFPLLWHEFAIGLAVFYRLNRSRGFWERRMVELGLVALIAAGILADGPNTAIAAAFGLLLIALRPLDRLSDGFRALEPLRACGRRCYSIYLVHLPACVIGNHWLYEQGLTAFWARALVMVPLVSAAGVAVGWAFHGAVEAYFLTPPTGLAGKLAPRLRPARRPALAGAE